MTPTIDPQSPIMRAIAWGIQAPNPHNTQAWKFRLVSDTEARLYVDERRLLPVTDPPARQIHIGAGCCIETLAVGMSTEGYETDVKLLPDGPHGSRRSATSQWRGSNCVRQRRHDRTRWPQKIQFAARVGRARRAYT